MSHFTPQWREDQIRKLETTLGYWLNDLRVSNGIPIPEDRIEHRVRGKDEQSKEGTKTPLRVPNMPPMQAKGEE